MNILIVFLAAACVVNGIPYDGLRVKFGWSDALAEKEYFYKIPRTISEAEGLGWQRTERPPGPLKELRMYCPPGKNVCPLFDTTGFVAGIQIALPVDDFESLAFKPEKRFVKWRSPSTESEPTKEYWTVTQYFVSEESLKSGAGPTIANGATLQDGGVWVSDLDGQQIRIPSTEAELNTTDFKKQNCIPNMGTHYYYKMTPDLKCDDFLPWFALTTQQQLIGTGFQYFGKLAEQKPVDWFERISSPKRSAEITTPLAPKCISDLADTYGIISMHIYYIDNPWTIRCSPGDSVKPAPVLDRLVLNGVRYASQVADEVKKLFSG